MSNYDDSQRGVVPPLKDDGTHTPQFLGGTGATEASNDKPFNRDRIHVLSVGAAPVRVLFGADPGTGSDVAPTEGAIVPANSMLRFRAVAKARYVYVEAADGSAAYTASVWQVEQ